MKKRIIAIARKEFLHIIHDIRSLAIIFVMPVIMLVLFGYALNLEIQNIDLAVFDYSRTPASRKLLNQFEASKFFTIQHCTLFKFIHICETQKSTFHAKQ